MREHSDTAKTLLAMIGMTETGQQQAAAMLACEALAAVNHVDDAERRATAALVAVRSHLADQFDHTAAGYRRNPVWVQQAADDYTRECAAITASCEKFEVSARAMALLLGMPYALPAAA